MTYTLIYNDKNDFLKKRKELRESHILYLKNYKENILIAGPILDKNQNPVGSLLVVDFESEEEVKNFSKNDPYNLGGLFKKVEIIRFKKVM